jgi:hypothetical protein
VSHELLTPLTFVKVYVEMLLDGDMGQINERQRESLSIVAEKTDSITRLVSDIIFLQQIEHESLQLAQLDMAQVVRRAMQSNQAPVTAAHMLLTSQITPDLPPAYADRDRVNPGAGQPDRQRDQVQPAGRHDHPGAGRRGRMLQVSVSIRHRHPQRSDRADFERFYRWMVQLRASLAGPG